MLPECVPGRSIAGQMGTVAASMPPPQQDRGAVRSMSAMFGPIVPCKNTAACFLADPVADGVLGDPSTSAANMLQSMFCSPLAGALAMDPDKWQAHAIAQRPNTADDKSTLEFAVPSVPEVPTVKSKPTEKNPGVSKKRQIARTLSNCSTKSEKASKLTVQSNCSIPASRLSNEGRAPKKEMAAAARVRLTIERIEGLGCNKHCTCKQNCCLYRPTEHERFGLLSNIYDLWATFNSADPKFHKGQALLDYMYEHENTAEGKKKSVLFKLYEGAPYSVCASCWRICAGFTKQNGTESGVYGRVRAMFNVGIKNARKERDPDFKESGDIRASLKLDVEAFLETWLEHNSDKIPEDTTAFEDFGKKRVHVDVPRKKDIWDACCEHLRTLHAEPTGAQADGVTKPPVSHDWFLKILNNKVHVVIHKHKKFSQCVTCFLFKQLMAKCTNPQDKKDIRAHRKKHFDTVFGERLIYHIGRNWAKYNPEQALSLILDGQTKWRTQGPTMSRQLGSGWHPDFEAFGQQLYGCLVHALPNDEAHKGGFFGYMVDDSVKGGGNVTCEIIYNTLLKLQEHREVWPPLCDIRLDNTTSDNKNKCVFGFMGWLVLTDVFKILRVRYLSVGHTHEDIDALFGVLMQHLYRGRCFETIEILMQEIYDSFFLTANIHASGNRPSSEVEHMRATHDWTSWLTTAVEKASGINAETGAEGEACPGKNKKRKQKKPRPAVAKLEKYARRVPDSFRPHEFVFEKKKVGGDMCVVLNYKHWSADEAYWNKEPIVVFNHTPDLKDLKPATLNGKVTGALTRCVAYPSFTDHDQLCATKKGPKDVNGDPTPSNLGNCPRCKVQVAFSKEHNSCNMFEEKHKDAWGLRFSKMTQESANSSLTDIRGLRHYNAEEPRLPYKLPNQMQGPSDAYLSVPPCTFDGYTEADYKKMLLKAGVGSVNGSVSSFAVQEVVGAMVDGEGNVLVAVVWADDTTEDGGTWIDLDDLNVLFETDNPDTTTDEEGPIHTQAEKDKELAKGVQRHNWDSYFGRNVDEDSRVCVAFNHGRDTTVYAGVIKVPDFDESNGLQHVHFPVAEADSLLGTAAQNQTEDHIDIRLDTLNCSEQITISFWVKSNHVALPFIQKKLPALNRSPEQPIKTKIRRRKKQSISSDSEEEPSPQTKKKSKVTCTTQDQSSRQKRPAVKKPTNKESRESLLKQMRQTPF